MGDNSSNNSDDDSKLSYEERIRQKKLEKEKLQKEAESKRTERLEREAAVAKARAEEELKRKVKEAAAAKIKAEEDRKRKIIEDEQRLIREAQEAEEAERRRIEFQAAEKERLKREKEAEIKRKKEEIEREKREVEEKKRSEKEQFFSKLGLGPDGKAAEDDIPIPIKEEETVEEAATRRFVLDELEFHGSGDEQSEVTSTEDLQAEDEGHDFIDQSDLDEPLSERGVRKENAEEGPEDESLSIDQLLADTNPIAPIEGPAQITPFHSETCQFCRIALHQLKPLMVFETSLIMAFLDPKPIHKGQLIITTKSHYPSLDKLPLVVMNDFILAAQSLTTALKNTSLDSQGVSLYMSESVDIPINERHLYMSAIPRRKADGVTIKFGTKQSVDKSLMLSIAQEIKSKL